MLKEQRKDILFDLYTESTHNRKFNIFSINSKNLNGKIDKYDEVIMKTEKELRNEVDK